MHVQFKDEGLEWVKLKDLKSTNPVELAEYNVINHLVDEPAFKWLVPHVIRKRNRIINKVKSKYWRISHKFGIRLSKTIDKVLQIDREIGTDRWRCAINKELARVKVA
eukprot:9217663-Ditylum_brightwellii.AAC.1